MDPKVKFVLGMVSLCWAALFFFDLTHPWARQPGGVAFAASLLGFIIELTIVVCCFIDGAVNWILGTLSFIFCLFRFGVRGTKLLVRLFSEHEKCSTDASWHSGFFICHTHRLLIPIVADGRDTKEGARPDGPKE